MDRKKHRFNLYIDCRLSWKFVAGTNRGYLSGFNYALNPSLSVLPRRDLSCFVLDKVWN